MNLQISFAVLLLIFSLDGIFSKDIIHEEAAPLINAQFFFNSTPAAQICANSIVGVPNVKNPTVSRSGNIILVTFSVVDNAQIPMGNCNPSEYIVWYNGTWSSGINFVMSYNDGPSCLQDYALIYFVGTIGGNSQNYPDCSTEQTMTYLVSPGAADSVSITVWFIGFTWPTSILISN